MATAGQGTSAGDTSAPKKPPITSLEVLLMLLRRRLEIEKMLQPGHSQNVEHWLNKFGPKVEDKRVEMIVELIETRGATYRSQCHYKTYGSVTELQLHTAFIKFAENNLQQKNMLTWDNIVKLMLEIRECLSQLITDKEVERIEIILDWFSIFVNKQRLFYDHVTSVKEKIEELGGWENLVLFPNFKHAKLHNIATERFEPVDDSKDTLYRNLSEGW